MANTTCPHKCTAVDIEKMVEALEVARKSLGRNYATAPEMIAELLIQLAAAEKRAETAEARVKKLEALPIAKLLDTIQDHVPAAELMREQDREIASLREQLQATDARLESCQTARDNLRKAREEQRQRIAELEAQLFEYETLTSIQVSYELIDSLIGTTAPTPTLIEALRARANVPPSH